MKSNSFGLSGGKSGMMFVSLHEKQADGSEWNDSAQNKLASLFTKVISYISG
jgi:hypothetical protein